MSTAYDPWAREGRSPGRAAPARPAAEPAARLVEDARVARYRFALTHVVGRKVVDIGCRDGSGTAMLAAAGARDVVGMDAPEPSFAEAGRRVVLPNLRFEPVTGETLPVADRWADVAICLDVLDQIARPEVLVREMRRVLLPGGTVIVSIASRRQAAGGVLGRLHRQPGAPAGMSDGELRALLEPCFGRLQLFGQSYRRAASPSFELLRSQQRATPLRLLSQSLFSALTTPPLDEQAHEGWVFTPGDTATAVSLLAVAVAE